MNAEQYKAAEKRIDALIDCAPGTPEADELHCLSTAVAAYEQAKQLEDVLWTAFALLEPYVEDDPKVLACCRDLWNMANKINRRIETMTPKPDRLVESILSELCGRKGFDDWWESIDEDVKREIEQALTLVIDRFNKASNADRS